MSRLSANKPARPFLKWAGGKSQLIPQIHTLLPVKYLSGNAVTYVEPFIGSGALLFYILRTIPQIQKAVISDINSDLINSYQVIKESPSPLIEQLKLMEEKYQSLQREEDKKAFFLDIRFAFNEGMSGSILSAAYLIFLNRTCYNGLYRVNSKNKFNVPFGKYVNPKICDADNIKTVSNILQKVIILNGDFEDTLKHITGKSFFYFDPPYRPISKTSAFNAYASQSFSDREQNRLALFCDKLNEMGHYWLLSNSDPKNLDDTDAFFDDLYSAYNIRRVNAKRMINSVSSKRGTIKEMLIFNYPEKII